MFYTDMLMHEFILNFSVIKLTDHCVLDNTNKHLVISI